MIDRAFLICSDLTETTGIAAIILIEEVREFHHSAGAASPLVMRPRGRWTEASLEQGVDKGRRSGRPEYDQETDQKESQDHRQEPPSPALLDVEKELEKGRTAFSALTSPGELCEVFSSAIVTWGVCFRLGL